MRRGFCRHLQAEIRSTEETQEQHTFDLQYYEKAMTKYNAKKSIKFSVSGRIKQLFS